MNFYVNIVYTKRSMKCRIEKNSCDVKDISHMISTTRSHDFWPKCVYHVTADFDR